MADMTDKEFIIILKKIAKGSLIAIAIVFLVVLVFKSFFIIDEGERGVLLRNGKFVNIADPGLSFKLPFFDKVVEISTQTHSKQYAGLTSYSKDQQPAIIKVSITYRIPSTEKEIKALYSTYGSVLGIEQRVLDRNAPTQCENVFGQFTAISAVQERVKFGIDLKSAIIHSVGENPIVIESVQVENIDFSKSYEKSVEDRMKAEVEVQTQKQTLDKEKISAEIAVTQAQGRADSELAKATADAKAIKLRGEAEAFAIEVKAKALAQNQNLIEMIKAQNWNGVLPTTMLPNSTIPFLEVGKK